MQDTLEIIEVEETDFKDNGEVMHWVCGRCTPNVSACGLTFKPESKGKFVKTPKFPCLVCEDLKEDFQFIHDIVHKE